MTASSGPSSNSAAVVATIHATNSDDRERVAPTAAAPPLVPPHRDRRGDERAGAVAGDQQRPHVARHDHRADQHERRRTPAARRSAASEASELPLRARRSASGVPRRKKNHAAPTISHSAADLGGELAQVGEQHARTRRRRGERDSARTTRRAASGPSAPAERDSPRRRPATASTRARARAAGARTRAPQNTSIASHRWPVVIEREVAIAGRAVRRQVEQQQPADAGRGDESGIAVRGRRHRPRIGTAPCEPRRDASRKPAAASIATTNGAGIASRQRRIAREPSAIPAASGHGTRPSPGDAAHAASASAVPTDGATPRRVEVQQREPGKRPQPPTASARCASSARIASSFASPAATRVASEGRRGSRARQRRRGARVTGATRRGRRAATRRSALVSWRRARRAPPRRAMRATRRAVTPAARERGGRCHFGDMVDTRCRTLAPRTRRRRDRSSLRPRARFVRLRRGATSARALQRT